MATTAPITSTPSPTATAGTTDAYSALGAGDFIKIIFSELSRQDPLNPSDTNALLQQLSSLRSIQSEIDLSNKIETVVTQNQLATAGGLLGKRVSGLDETSSARVEGTVTSVSKTDTGPVLVLDNGSRVPFSTVDQFLGDVPPATGDGSLHG